MKVDDEQRRLVAKAPENEGLSLCPRTGATVWTPPRGMRPPEEGGRSPWGTINDLRELVPGIWIVSTPGHGGLWLSRDRIAQLPHGWETFVGKRVCRNDTARWHEEDCDLTMALWVLGGHRQAGRGLGLQPRQHCTKPPVRWPRTTGATPARNYERGLEGRPRKGGSGMIHIGDTVNVYNRSIHKQRPDVRGLRQGGPDRGGRTVPRSTRGCASRSTRTT